ncbi:hypothetical protein [Longitalea luteola]|uniref:hypothetical protein n=1 Tax=Longitalea luteola TaxID=2812563 RepID=UPI001A95D491|nr:hypothetical protein [Longitalea luteola]
MKKIVLLLIVALTFSKANAQFVHKIRADSVLITNDSCTAELNLENSTKHIKGFLYNKSNGRTEFRKIEKLNDSMLVFGGDTVGIGWPSSQLTLQQVTGYGNTTSNTIKPYPNALPVGASTDSVVVWSANDSLLKKIAPLQTFAQTATVTVSNTTSETTLIGSGTGSLVIPPAAWGVGKSFEVTVQGIYSTDIASPTSITLRLKLGSTVIASSGTITMNPNRINIPFVLQATITCISTGSSGSIYTFGDLYRDGKTNAVNNGSSASTINTTTSQTLSATAQLSDSSNGNSLSAFVVTLDPVN